MSKLIVHGCWTDSLQAFRFIIVRTNMGSENPPKNNPKSNSQMHSKIRSKNTSKNPRVSSASPWSRYFVPDLDQDHVGRRFVHGPSNGGISARGIS